MWDPKNVIKLLGHGPVHNNGYKIRSNMTHCIGAHYHGLNVPRNKFFYVFISNRVHRVLMGKPEGKRPLGRPRRRWEDNIKMDLQEMGGGYGDWMELAQDRDRWRALVSVVMNFRVP
jgi:hypothetical protein